jgi:hypothetical protein
MPCERHQLLSVSESRCTAHCDVTATQRVDEEDKQSGPELSPCTDNDEAQSARGDEWEDNKVKRTGCCSRKAGFSPDRSC